MGQPDLTTYLDRIGFHGSTDPSLETLTTLQRVHVENVPFENLDVLLGRCASLDLQSCYAKVVTARRGGWCYELNGLLGWALREIGFDVLRVSAGVMRETAGDAQLGNHLCLLVRLEELYLVDVGFGGSLSKPLPLIAAEHDDAPYRITLSDAGENYWRFSERTDGEAFSFDFKAVAAEETLFATKCTYLQTDAASPFVQNLVVQRRFGATHLSVRGRVLTVTNARGEQKKTLESSAELVALLHSKFDLTVPEVETLWPAICARHAALFGPGKKLT